MEESLVHNIENRFIRVAAKCTDAEYKALQVFLSKYCCLVCLPGYCNSKEQLMQLVSDVESDYRHYLYGVSDNVVLLYRCTRKLKPSRGLIYIDSTFVTFPDWKHRLISDIETRQRITMEKEAIAKINGALLPNVKGISALYDDVEIKNNTVSIIASGTSVDELSDTDLEYIKSNSLMFGINYSVVRFNPDVLIWADHEPAQYLNQFYKDHKKETLLLGNAHSVMGNDRFSSLVGTAFWRNVDYWWTPKGMLKNLSLTWLLQLLNIYFPPDIRILLFGVDLYGAEKWYDSYIAFDKAKKLLDKPKKDDSVAITSKDLRRTQVYLKELLRAGRIPEHIYNCNPTSKLEVFEKRLFKELI